MIESVDTTFIHIRNIMIGVGVVGVRDHAQYLNNIQKQAPIP
jgi:hypothetical protein